MSLPWSLRGRLLLGAALWTVGLFFLAIVLWHVTLGNRHPPALMAIVFDHAARRGGAVRRAPGRRPAPGAARLVADQPAAGPARAPGRRRRTAAGRRVSQRGGAARRRPQRAARSARAVAGAGAGQGRRPGARPEDAAGRARAGGRSRRRGGSAGARRCDPPAGRTDASAGGLPARAGPGRRLGPGPRRRRDVRGRLGRGPGAHAASAARRPRRDHRRVRAAGRDRAARARGPRRAGGEPAGQRLQVGPRPRGADRVDRRRSA